MTEEPKKKVKVAFIAAGKYHDIDFARLEILKILAINAGRKPQRFGAQKISVLGHARHIAHIIFVTFQAFINISRFL